MTSRGGPSHIGHIAHHAASEANSWDGTAEELRERFAAQAVGFFEHAVAAGGSIVRHAAGIAPEFRDSYGRRPGTLNPWLEALAKRQGADEAVRGNELLPDWQLVRQDFYRTWLRPQRLLHALIGILSRSAGATSAVIVLRGTDRQPFSSTDAGELTPILGELRCAWRLGADLAASRSFHDVLLDLLAALPEAAMVVARDGRALLANRAARALLPGREGVGLVQGRVAARSPAETARLRRAVAASINADGQGMADHAPEPAAGGRPLLARLQPLCHPLVDADGTRHRVAALLVRITERQPAADALSRRYRMTLAERRLVTPIVGGRSLVEAARQLHISRNTARTHMKHIHAKTGAHRQVDLVRLVGVPAEGSGVPPAVS